MVQSVGPEPMGSIAALIVLALVLVLAVAGAVALVVLLKRRGGEAGQSGTCGQCGYRVTGLTTFNCPECGGDLREVGIVKPAAPGNPWVWVVLIFTGVALLLLTCVCLLTPMLASAG